MSTTTYKVRFTGQLSGKRFHDALKLVKDAGGAYDEHTKTWTVIAEDDVTVTSSCGGCGGTGRPILHAANRDGTECPGDCKQFGAHRHATYKCPDCKGSGSRGHTNMSPARRKLLTVEQSYGAEITAVNDDGRALLEAERRQILARLAEIDKLLSA